MFEKDEDYRKARKESKDEITKVIKVWSAREETLHDEGFQKGAEYGYNKAKANEVHDMLENPHDTPNDCEEVIVSGRTGMVKAVAVFHRRLDGTFFWTSMDKLIEEHSEGLFKWCRIPTFSEEK